MRILISDESLAPALVRCGCEVFVAPDVDTIIADLQVPGHAEALILDWSLVADRPELIEVLQPLLTRDDLYALVALPRDRSSEVDMVAACLADDIVFAPVDRLDLELRVRAARRFVELQAKLRTARETHERDSSYDPVTGVMNRRALDAVLLRETSRASRLNSPLAVIFVDLDHFKRVNDEYGHAAGDTVLASAAACLNSMLRPYDSVGRYGGEEFVLTLPGCTAAQAKAVAERLREKLSSQVVDVARGQVRVTASFGVAATDIVPNATVAALLHAADAAVYAAKAAGRNRVIVAEGEVRELAPRDDSELTPGQASADYLHRMVAEEH
jgi:diguanylate cyclase (GGDEF)-like protein